jgi:hypothetical protein
MDATAIIVACIVGGVALWNQRSTQRTAQANLDETRAARLAAEAAKATGEATQTKVEEVAVTSDGKLTTLQTKLEAVEGELRRLKADPTATTPEKGGAVNLAEDTGKVTVDQRRRHDDPPGIDLRAGEK